MLVYTTDSNRLTVLHHSCRELDASRNLELAQFKIAQLVSELESNKEVRSAVFVFDVLAACA